MPPNTNEYDRAYQNRRNAERWQQAVEKLGGKCAVCGSTNNLQIDHIDPSTKSFDISGANCSRERLEAEVAKCQVLCQPHHNEKTRRDLGHTLTKGQDVHGTLTAYRYCRCDLCRAAKSNHARAVRIAKGLPVRDGTIAHGKHSTYVHHKCRCDLCREANRIHCAKYKKRGNSSAR